MKYIIIGLGNFGGSLAQKLTAQGNEVIGIDKNMSIVDAFKEKISHTICMDSTDEITVSGLPLEDTDIVVVSIGENQGANIMTTALLKSLDVKRVISRAINPLHEKVLQAIGVDEIVSPEEETAERWAKKLCLTNVVDSFEVNEDYSIIEAKVPSEYVGKTVREVDFKAKFKLIVLTIIKKVEVKNIFGKSKSEAQIQGVSITDNTLEPNDILVLYGSNKDLKSFLKQKLK